MIVGGIISYIHILSLPCFFKDMKKGSKNKHLLEVWKKVVKIKLNEILEYLYFCHLHFPFWFVNYSYPRGPSEIL